MPWVRIDDQYPEHPKITAAGHLAGWLDVCAMAYSNRMLTDGFIADAMVPRLSSVPAPSKRAAELVAAGRWVRVEGGYQIHDYLDYQKTKVQILKEREQANRRQFKRRHGVTPDVTSGANHARPTPTPTTEPVVRTLTSVPDPDRDTAVDNPPAAQSIAAAKRAVGRAAPDPSPHSTEAHV